MNNQARVIIGESERAGLPISAPVEKDIEYTIPPTTIRWRKKGESFVLEQWKLENPRGPTRGVWVEVPCVESSNANLTDAGTKTL